MRRRGSAVKSLPALAAIAVAAVAVAGCGSSSGSSGKASSGPAPKQTLTVGWYGGPIGATFDKVVVKPFEKATGINVQVQTAFDDTRLTALESNPNALDVAFFTSAIMPNVLKAGVATPITTSEVPRLADVYPSLKSSDYFGWSFGVWGIAYNADKITTPPTSWGDMLNPAYKGHVTGPDITYNSSVFSLLALAKLNGGSLTNLTPGFDAMKKLRANSPFFWSSDSTMLPDLENGSIWMSAYANGGTYLAAQAKGAEPIKFVVPKEGGYIIPFNLVIPKGAKSPSEAREFANFLLQPSVQLAWAKAIYYSPANQDTQIPANLKSKIVSGSAVSKLLTLNWGQYAKEQAQVTQEWQSQIH